MYSQVFVSGFFRFNDQLAFARVSDDVLGRPQVKFWLWGVNPWIETPKKLNPRKAEHWSMEPLLSLLMDRSEGVELYSMTGDEYSILESWSAQELDNIYGDWSFSEYECFCTRYQEDPASVLDLLMTFLEPVISLQALLSLDDFDLAEIEIEEHALAIKAASYSQSFKDDLKGLGFFEFFPFERFGFEGFEIDHNELQKTYKDGKFYQIHTGPSVFVTYRKGVFDVPEPVYIYKKRSKWFMFNLEAMEEEKGPFPTKKSCTEVLLDFEKSLGKR